MHSKNNISKNGFTLIELLVVITIITLLISILLPALSAARRAAQAVQCLSNERQAMLAMAVYQNDHDSTYAPFVILTPRLYWPGMLIKGNYISTLKVFDCPSFQSADNSWRNTDDTTVTEFGYNSDCIGGDRLHGNYYTPAKAYQIKQPSQTVLFLDSRLKLSPLTGSYTVPSIPDSRTNGRIPAPRHSGSVNIVWTDGHASSVKALNPNDPLSLYDSDSLGNASNILDQPNKWDRE